jgi:hypothetical protein
MRSTAVTNYSAQHGRNTAVLFPFSKSRRARAGARPQLSSSGCTQAEAAERIYSAPGRVAPPPIRLFFVAGWAIWE